VYRTEPVQPSLRTYIPRPVFEEKFSPGKSFSYVQRPLYVKIKIINPELTFKKDLEAEKEELVSVISSGLVQRKGIEIDCGPVDLKTNYAAGELTQDDFVKRVQSQDGQNTKAELETRRIRHHFFSLFGTKHNFVTFARLRNEVQRNNQVLDSPDYSGFLPNEPYIGSEVEYPNLHYADPDFDPAQEPDNGLSTEIDEAGWELINGGSRYSNAPTVIVDENDIYNLVSQIDYWLDQRGIVQIKRRNQTGRVEELGMFLEKEFDNGEVVFNLNGQTENHFRDIFKSLAMYYLRAGKTVMVDCDIELYAEDLPKIWDRVLEGEIHDMVYQPIVSELGILIDIERRRIQRVVHEDRNYIVMRPKQVR